MELKYEIEQSIATISEKNGYTKELNLVSWNGHAAALDLRKWDRNQDIPQKGISLSIEEAKELNEALTEYLKDK